MTIRPVVLGKISGVVGVTGWVKVYSFTQPIENLINYSPWYLGQALEKYSIIDARAQGKPLTARLADGNGDIVNDRDMAAALVGNDIAVDRSQMPVLPDGEYYWCDLIGCHVFNRDEFALGTVTDMLETNAHGVMILNGERERLIPFVANAIVDRVDIDAKRIDVDWPADA